jgi:hypothetical protein
MASYRGRTQKATYRVDIETNTIASRILVKNAWRNRYYEGSNITFSDVEQKHRVWGAALQHKLFPSCSFYG